MLKHSTSTPPMWRTRPWRVWWIWKRSIGTKNCAAFTEFPCQYCLKSGKIYNTIPLNLERQGAGEWRKVKKLHNWRIPKHLKTNSLLIFLLQNEFCPTFRFLIHFGIPKTGWGTIWNFQKSSKNSKSSKTEIHNKDNLSTSILRGSCCPGHVPKCTAPWMSRPWLEFPYLVASVTNRGRWSDRTAGGLARLSQHWVAAHVPCTTQDQEL